MMSGMLWGSISEIMAFISVVATLKVRMAREHGLEAFSSLVLRWFRPEEL